MFTLVCTCIPQSIKAPGLSGPCPAEPAFDSLLLPVSAGSDEGLSEGAGGGQSLQGRDLHPVQGEREETQGPGS